MKRADPIFIFQHQKQTRVRLTKLVEELGYLPVLATSAQEAIALLDDEENQFVALLVEHSEVGVDIAQYIRGFTSLIAPLIALVEEGADASLAIKTLEADTFVRQPLTTDIVHAVLQLAQTMVQTRQRLHGVEQTLADLQRRLDHRSTANSASGFRAFDSVKDLLSLEVRRAKRYGYPLSVLLVGLDPHQAHRVEQRPALSRQITALLATAISKSIRVVDLPIHYADDRLIVFLPHTELPGAEEVARRIKRRIKRITYREPSSSFTLQLTASVGISGITDDHKAPFSKLIKDAISALKAAQLKGGDRIIVKRARGERTVLSSSE